MWYYDSSENSTSVYILLCDYWSPWCIDTIVFLHAARSNSHWTASWWRWAAPLAVTTGKHAENKPKSGAQRCCAIFCHSYPDYRRQQVWESAMPILRALQPFAQVLTPAHSVVHGVLPAASHDQNLQQQGESQITGLFCAKTTDETTPRLDKSRNFAFLLTVQPAVPVPAKRNRPNRWKSTKPLIISGSPESLPPLDDYSSKLRVKSESESGGDDPNVINGLDDDDEAILSHRMLISKIQWITWFVKIAASHNYTSHEMMCDWPYWFPYWGLDARAEAW